MTVTLFKETYRIETTRLCGWDYASAGWYFVTICTYNRQPFFGWVEHGKMHLSSIGEIACEYWQAIPQHTVGSVALDAFVVMPDHIHGIIVIHDGGVGVETLQCNVSTPTPPPPPRDPNNPMSQISPKPGSLGAIIRSYKSAVSRWCSRNGFSRFAWQSRYYDHIIRNERALQRIRQYIIENPARWEMDPSSSS